MEKKRGFRLSSLVVWSLLGLIVAAIIGLALASKKTVDDIEVPEEKSVAVRVSLVEPRRILDRITLPGWVEPVSKADVAAEKGGRVAELAVEKGSRVEANQVLLRLDSGLWRAYLRKAEIQRRETERDLARWKELQKTGAVSQSEFDRITAARDLAAAALDEAGVHVSQCEVRSPIDGTVDARYVEKGEYVNEGGVVFSVVDTSQVKLILDIPEQDVMAIAIGKELAFSVAAVPARVFTGSVVFVSIQAGRDSNCFRAEILVDNRDELLRPGMIAEASLVRGVKENAVVVPLVAIIAQRGEHIVFVEEDGFAVRRVVGIESIAGHEVILASGLTPGERLIVEGHRTLQDGVLLNVVQ